MEHIIIDEKLNIRIPESLKIIPQYNHNVQTYTVDCPRYTQNGEDMLEMVPFISVEKKGVKEPVVAACSSPILDEADESMIHFNWTIRREVTDTPGKIGIVVCVRRSEEENLENAWHTFKNEEIEIKKGIDCGLDMLMQYPGLIEEILYRLGIVEKSGGAVPDKTLTISGAPADAKVVGDRCSQLQQTNVDRANSLWNVIKKTAFTERLTDAELTAFKTAWGITEEEPDIPDEPDVPEVTLSSISATYTGGEVTVGTALTDLTGITVKAHYSDGSTANVTGYTLNGEIAEGENTITVSYGGLTTTFTVTGVAESGGEDTEPLYTLESCNDVTVLDRYNNAQYPALLTVNGNDIKWIAGEGGEHVIWYFNANCSSANTNGANGRTAPTWFTIPSGANVELKCSNVSDNWNYDNRIGLNKTGNTTFFEFAVGGKPTLGSVQEAPVRSFTATMTEDTEINALVIDFGSALTTEQSIHVELYVNGVRWI